jgi:hypothetical protein
MDFSVFRILEAFSVMLDVQIDTPEAAMRQAWMTANDYFMNAIECIDMQFGDGYAKQHPELVSAFMQTCARDFQTTLMKAAAQDRVRVIAGAADMIRNAIRGLASATSGYR